MRILVIYVEGGSKLIDGADAHLFSVLCRDPTSDEGLVVKKWTLYAKPGDTLALYADEEDAPSVTLVMSDDGSTHTVVTPKRKEVVEYLTSTVPLCDVSEDEEDEDEDYKPQPKKPIKKKNKKPPPENYF